MKTPAIAFALSLTISCTSPSTGVVEQPAAKPYEELLNQLDSADQEAEPRGPDIEGLEMEVNNGGFNQYFINSPGQNCFETLRELQRTGKVKTAALLAEAIRLVNTGNLPEEAFIEQLRKRDAELDNADINAKLDSLDLIFFKYPDGPLQ